MPSTSVLRLTVLVHHRERAPAHPSLSGALLRGNNDQPGSTTEKPRAFLLVIKDPETMSLGELAIIIKDQWQELWPTEEPLQIKRLLNEGYPDAAFTVRCSVADIWVDSGRREREGFDQRGTVRVVQVPSSSTPTPTHRHQRAASVFQDVEGAAREAKRKSLETGISANDSLTRTGATTSSRNKEPTDPQHHQSKRPRVTEETDTPSPSPVGRPQGVNSSPVFYNDGRVPSFAHPRGHRRHLPNNSTGSPKIGLGLGITASPVRVTDSNNNVTADGTPGPSSMPPPPPRYLLRGPINSSLLGSSSQDDSPLGTRKPTKRPFNSVPREASRNKGPRTRASNKASGSGKRSHHATTPSSAPVAVPKLNITPDYAERDRKEHDEVKELLKGSKINPSCLPLLRQMLDLHEEKIKLKAGSCPDASQRKRLLGMNRRTLSRRREMLDKLKRSGELYEETDAPATTSEDDDTEEGPGEGRDEGSDEDVTKKNSKQPRIEKRDISGDFAAARRISSLRAYSKGVKFGDRPQIHKDKEPDRHGIQVVIGNGTEQASPSVRNPGAHASKSNGCLPGGAASEENESVNEDDMNDSDGVDIPFEAQAPKVSPIHNPTASQRTSLRNVPPPGAETGESANGVNGVDHTAKDPEPSEMAQLVAAIEQVPEQQYSGFPTTLRELLQQRKEAFVSISPFGAKGQKQDESSATSDDETSEDDSSDADGDFKM